MGNVGKDSAHVSAVVSKQTKAFLDAYAAEANYTGYSKLVKDILSEWSDGGVWKVRDDAAIRKKAAAISGAGFSSRPEQEAPEQASQTAPKRRRAS